MIVQQINFMNKTNYTFSVVQKQQRYIIQTVQELYSDGYCIYILLMQEANTTRARGMLTLLRMEFLVYENMNYGLSQQRRLESWI